MYSVGYRASVMSLAATASRRVYHASRTSIRNTVRPTIRSKTTTRRGGQIPPSSARSSRQKTTTTGGGGGKHSQSSSSSWIQNNPFVFQLGIATCKTSAADLLAQVVAEGKTFDEIDWKRNSIFVVFGFAYLGGFQYWLQINKYRAWFPTMDRFAKLPFVEKLKDTAGMLDALKMVVFDVVVHLPIIYFPTYYTVKEFVYSTSYNPLDWIQTGCTAYYANLSEDLTAMIQLWGPADCIQFVLPMHIRLPFRHLVSFFWTAYVSFTRGSALVVTTSTAAAVDDNTTIPQSSTILAPTALQRQLTTETPK